ncbi:NAD(P)-binding protein [Massarina eburnea CBS 473.64]|uniref:NAD(P)-binding protein n=1 Tax=Massarina eburnea CBS 473.64 TaxID=1395130 RepID=A0A6A6SCF4_9PLEO|nr:NAD(P)-binding protein [Massarina eburnea CBS 473.64]
MSEFDPATLFGVKGLVAVITGGGTGIGLIIAQALEANGAIVYILGRRQEKLDEAASTAKHANIHTISADVTSKDDLSAAAKHIEEKEGFINLLIANSGVMGPTSQGLAKDASLDELQSFLFSRSSEAFTNTLAVNTTAVYFTIAAFLGLLGKGNEKGNVEQKSQVVAVGSIGGFSRVPSSGYAYPASKSGVTHLMKQFATSLVPYGIRSNVICPGLYPTELSSGVIQDRTEFPKDFIPLQRAGTVDDMAGAALFLCSKAGAYINGNVLVTDGGRMSVLPATY